LLWKKKWARASPEGRKKKPEEKHMSQAYTLIESLGGAVGIPEDGILSKPIFSDARMRVTLFGLAAGQEMTEHTTTMEAVLQFLEGEAEITLGADKHTVGAGAWIQMAPNLAHSIKATQPLKMLLIVLRPAETA
jgi:quercetin dioxygenase-like cupin family protein